MRINNIQLTIKGRVKARRKTNESMEKNVNNKNLNNGMQIFESPEFGTIRTLMMPDG